MSAHNQQVLEESLKKARKVAERRLIEKLLDLCDRIIVDAYQTRTFTGFTGNTQTSYACAIYEYGTLRYMVVAQDDGLELPVRLKVKKGEWSYLDRPYEGTARGITGAVDVDIFYGSETSRHFLEQYQAPDDGFCIVVCTGTEYSLYLEQVKNFDVLTQTYQRTPTLFNQCFKD